MGLYKTQPYQLKMLPQGFEISRYETTAVHYDALAEVDIVLVHGINGHPQSTWMADDGTFWPRDLLPASLRDARANVLVYGYNADAYSRRSRQSASDNSIHQHAQSLVASLTLYRQSDGASRNPIIWICHSLGGIIVKRALLYSNDLKDPHHENFRSIFVSTFAIVFLGTPHMGSDAAAWGCTLQTLSSAVFPRKLFESESVLLRSLKKDNETLNNINNHFLDIYSRFRIHMVHENHKTDVKGTKIVVVDANSASPQLPGVTYYGVEATHCEMCKFKSPSSPGFRTLSTDIRDWVLKAPLVISQRWNVEDEERKARVRNDIQEKLSPYPGQIYFFEGLSPAFSTPNLIVTPPPSSSIGLGQYGGTSSQSRIRPLSADLDHYTKQVRRWPVEELP